MASRRDYSAAVAALNTLQSNFAVIDQIRKSGRRMNENAIPEMIDWLSRAGYEQINLNRLRSIHIAGTKGKGSTSAFISSILTQYGTAFRKVGLYTSPHLRSVRERIQINNEPLSEEAFATYFFEVWDRLEAAAQKLGPPNPDEPQVTKPVYFRFLTLMAFHAFYCEGVDACIVECGIGGEYDSTNVLAGPVLSAVTSLGLDHTNVLGDTIEEIAWHKAGVFKDTMQTKQVFTVEDQPEAAMKVLQKKANEMKVTLYRVGRHPDIESGKVTLGLEGDFQKLNASLAVAIAYAFLRNRGHDDVPDPDSKAPLPEAFMRGLQQVRWPGRCEVRREGNISWYIDGGHTIESIKLATQWFAGHVNAAAQEAVGRKRKRVLLFNQQTRDARALARTLHSALSETLVREVASHLPKGGNVDQGMYDILSSRAPLFTHAFFCTNVTFAAADSGAGGKDSGRYKPDLLSINNSAEAIANLSVQNGLADEWSALDENRAVVSVKPTIEEAISAIRKVSQEKFDGEHQAEDVDVLVTGSLHLVGGVLEVLETTGLNTTI